MARGKEDGAKLDKIVLISECTNLHNPTLASGSQSREAFLFCVFLGGALAERSS